MEASSGVAGSRLRLTLTIVPNAERQIREAAAWWQRNRSSAPDLFLQQIHRGFELAATQPEAGTRARDLTLAEVRRLHLARIHYHLYYTVRGETVEILALWHTSRGTPPKL